MSQRGSQCGEDIIVEALLPPIGVFVEVGASNGLENSNTIRFEDKGWTGLLVEPDPRLIHQLKANRPKAIIERCAVGVPDGRCFHLSSKPTWGGLARDGGMIPISIVPLGELLDDHNIGHINLLSIDTEGTEAEVWRTFDKVKHRPTVVIIEHDTAGLPNKAEELTALLADDGYRVVRITTYNLIAVHD